MGLQDTDTAAFTSTDGQKPAIGWNNASANFRVDWNATSADNILFSANVYRSSVGHEYPVQPAGQPFPALLNGNTTEVAGSILARWEHRLSNGSDLTGQFSWEHSNNSDVDAPYTYDILNVDFHHQTASANGSKWFGVSVSANRSIAFRSRRPHHFPPCTPRRVSRM